MDFDFVQEQPKLRAAPLKTVLAQMRFTPQLGFGEALARPIQRRLVEQYPRAEIAQVAEIRLDAVGVTPILNDPIFHFRDSTESWTVSLTRSFVSLETSAYIDFKDFIRRWHEIVCAVADEFDLDRQERIGLRYVNEVEMPSNGSAESLRRLLRPEMVGVVGAHASTERLISSMQELRFAEDRGACTLRHGLLSRENVPVYVVDLDLYDDSPGPFDPSEQARLMGAFNHRAFDLFRWLWHPEQFATFEPEERT